MKPEGWRAAFGIQRVPIFACPNFGLISPPRWPHTLQTNFGSMSDSSDIVLIST